MLISDDEIITKPLDSSFLHGMTRASILTIAADLGYMVSERDFTVTEMLELAPTHEAALSGTAAGLAPVGCFVYEGKEIPLRNGAAGANTKLLRKALQDIQFGVSPDSHGWLTEI